MQMSAIKKSQRETSIGGTTEVIRQGTNGGHSRANYPNCPRAGQYMTRNLQEGIRSCFRIFGLVCRWSCS
jgi:hypothetical protein